MPANLFYAEEGSVTIGGTDFTLEVKEVSVTGGGRDVEAIRCFGNNSYFDEKPQEPFECSLTVIKKDADLAAMLLEGTDASDPRLWSGDSTPRSQARQIIFTWDDTTAVSGPAVRVTMSSAFAVSKELSLNSTDHLEETINIKSLAKNYKEEATATKAGAGALP